ncbi:aldo/keto reductase [Rhizobium lentis]|uniref:Aryl-alcohol dehydrogenase-like predicted oxidoreductase n=1 Tax=Rhizobium lentis TaxID=1138194 RepID=A0A7W8UK86_9HYPH|nr:aldo/keto reductase [Rhizobium lentis]MBB4573079.1 aryl-alcohol dehydrogenase-like predicted oxidoreductase [Rhizobium lentis]MBB5549008.1 aryl-alcohol dehydrogenase-like predicted oxidoreductase [Rhizobium lentis]MBB5559541.1 aryl-alcohol dehydrogenase-like predicted oxidoreductase [Rhizobium lentis]MBB5566575.1 aryl-alcohol dehydrogenase-like predicted oxidoreductase [Rhizobium lentis]
MEMRQLGKTGLSVAPIVIGGNVFGWTADEKTSFAVLDAFFDAGLNAIDTADVYSSWVPGNKGGDSEEIIGRWLKQARISRDQAVIITKVGSDMGRGKTLKASYILKAVEASLSRLQTDYIDLYLSHWPDADTPHEETLGAYAKLKAQGKVRAIGCSNYDAGLLQASFDAAEKAGLPRYDVLQPEYNLYERSSFEGPLAELCVKEDIGVITYFSLAAGFLTGKYRSKADTQGRAREGRVSQYLDENGLRILAALDKVSAETGAKPAEISLAWLLRKKGVTAPIASATNLSQLESLVKAATLSLSDDAMALLDEAKR